MTENNYIHAYKSIKAPLSLKEKLLHDSSPKRRFNYKALISAAACVIILLAAVPAYVGFTDPGVSVLEVSPIAARSIETQIPVRLELKRASTITVSYGELTDYDGGSIKGNADLTWVFIPDDTQIPTLTVKDLFGTTVYSLSYNENNGSWSIIKN